MVYKHLPRLLKPEECYEFIVVVENIIDHKNERELFTFNIFGHSEENFYILHKGILCNHYTGRINSPFKGYCKELAMYYNCDVLHDLP